ncbi:MAG: hypothetical protein QF473_25545, partial [Planctomycetota bacterium]|nr:hypothetical protein [Planctomycetota bacterium]
PDDLNENRKIQETIGHREATQAVVLAARGYRLTTTPKTGMKHPQRKPKSYPHSHRTHPDHASRRGSSLPPD